jgi:hypothetical protein
MTLYYKADDPKYDYLPTHFLETPYVTIHGWLPIYFIRFGIEIFGKNEIGPRFFSVLFFGLALTTLYIMVREFSSSAVSLCVVVYFSLIPTLLGYAMQGRYYAYELFFCFFGILSFLRFTQTQNRVRLWILVASEVMLYYTFIPAFFMHQAVFSLFLLISRRDLFKKFVLYAGLIGIFALPHLLITKLPMLVFRIPFRHSIDAASIPMVFSLLEWNLFLIISAIALFLSYVLLIIPHWETPGKSIGTLIYYVY